MRVEREPSARDPQALLAEILAPHGITLARGPGDTLMLVRQATDAPRHARPGAPDTPAPAPIDTVVVSASHYYFGESPLPPIVLGAVELESMPDIGEDPVRAVARLPGVASQDFSSRVHLRGGTPEETLFRFDDLRLYNPYHLKDFFGVFSSIDPGIVSDIRVLHGRLSGRVRRPQQRGGRHRAAPAGARLPGAGGRIDDDCGSRARRRLRGRRR